MVLKARFSDAFEVWIYFVDVQNIQLLIIFYMCIAYQTFQNNHINF